MNLQGWSIDGFGVFRDYEVRDIADGLTVLTGPNEAGKSTLLGFVRGALFGFGDGRSRDARYPPLRGGRHGGRVFVSDGQGNGSYIIERYVARKPPVRIFLPDGREGTQADLRLLLGGADDRLFRNVFAFSLTELQSFDSLSEEGVRDRIFSAGIAGAGRSAREAIRELDRRASALLKSRAQAPINTLVTDIARVKARLDDARAEVGRFAELLRREEHLTEEIVRLGRDADNLRRSRDRYQLLVELWPTWDELTAVEGELSALAPVDEFPDDAEAKLTAAVHELRTAEEAIEDQRRLQNSAQARLDELVPNERLAAVASELEELHETLALHRNLMLQLPASRMKLFQTKAAVEERLRVLGPEWDEARLEAFDRSIPRQEEVRTWEGCLQRAEREADRLRIELETAAKKACQLEEALEGETQLAIRDQPDEAHVTEQGHLLRRLRANLADLRVEEAEAVGHDGVVRERERAIRLLQTNVPRIASSWPAAAAWMLAAAATGGGMASGDVQAALLIASAAVSLAGIVSLFVWWRRSRTSVDRQRQDAELAIRREERDFATIARDTHQQRAADLASRVREDGAALGLPERPAAEVLEEREAELARTYTFVQEWRERYRRVLNAQSEAAAARADVQRLEDLARDAAATYDADLRKWESWKQAGGLPESLSPQGVLDYFDAIRVCQDAMHARKAANAEAVHITHQVATWQERGRTALVAAGVSAGTLEDERLIEALLTLRRCCMDDRELRTTRASLEQEIRERAARILTMESTLARARECRAQLLETAGAADETAFRQRLQVFRQRSALKQRYKDLERQIGARTGRGSEADVLRQDLTTGAVEEWQHRAAALEREVDALQAQRDDMVRRHRDASRCREELESSTDIVRFEAELEGLQAELNAAAREWRAVILARTLIDETLREFERTRQPAVLAHASEMFSFVTAGRYTRVVQEENGEEIAIVDRSGVRRAAEALSRGTAEQLYLCIRLALAAEFARRSTPLPLVMDDVLVNMDPERSRKIAEVLAGVARQHQVLLFTCHPNTRDLLLDVEPAARCVDLQPIDPAIVARPATQQELWSEFAVEDGGTVAEPK